MTVCENTTLSVCTVPWCPDCDPEVTADAVTVVENVVELPSGMVRSDNAGKTDYTLVRDGPMYERWARHLTAAVPSKGKRNWMRADSAEDLERFRESAARHFEAWLRGEDDEDHAAAVFFNVSGVEYVKARL